MKFFEKRKPENNNYSLLINRSEIPNIQVKYIKNFKVFLEYIIKNKNNISHECYFIQGQTAFNGIGVDFEVDLVFVNRDQKIIALINNHKKNSISKNYPDCHFIYIFENNFLSKNKLTLEDVLSRERIK